MPMADFADLFAWESGCVRRHDGGEEQHCQWKRKWGKWRRKMKGNTHTHTHARAKQTWIRAKQVNTCHQMKRVSKVGVMKEHKIWGKNTDNKKSGRVSYGLDSFDTREYHRQAIVWVYLHENKTDRLFLSTFRNYVFAFNKDSYWDTTWSNWFSPAPRPSNNNTTADV